MFSIIWPIELMCNFYMQMYEIKTFIWHLYQILGSLKLGETCTYAKQCTGTKHASECLYNHESDTKMCSCMKDYVASSTKCISGMYMFNHFVYQIFIYNIETKIPYVVWFCLPQKSQLCSKLSSFKINVFWFLFHKDVYHCKIPQKIFILNKTKCNTINTFILEKLVKVLLHLSNPR